MDGTTLSPEELDALTEEERNSLLAVLERARFEKAEDDEVHKPIEGQLMKWTNVVKGWQQRWFYLSPDVGLLHYFLSEDKKVMGPRGSLRLVGAIVQPSGEDPQMFSVVPQQGDPYKLRASNAKERQVWIDRVRRVIEKHTTDVNTLVKAAAASMPQQSTAEGQGVTRSQSVFRKSKRTRPVTVGYSPSQVPIIIPPNGPPTPKQLVDMNLVLHNLNTAHRNQLQIALFCEDSIQFADHAVLKYKSSSQALFKLLDECYNIINQLKIEGDARERMYSVASVTSGDKSSDDPLLRSNSLDQRTADSLEEATFSDTYNHITDSLNYDNGDDHTSPRITIPSDHELGEMTSQGHVPVTSRSHVTRSSSVVSSCDVTANWEKINITPEQSVKYDKAYEEGEEGDTDVGDHKSVIMSLLGQLKLGMDLTKVVLPTFILERKSLLELFANCFSHPDIFMSITDGTSPEERILRATKWLLTSFHAGRKGSVAKKPYNPIIGEVFHCKWDVDSSPGPSSTPDRSTGHCIAPDRSTGHCIAPDRSTGHCIAPGQVGNVTFLAEQVSHHPPVSAFYTECKHKRTCANYSVWTKSKFLGISVGVDMVGVGTIHLLDHGEKYHFTLPSTFGRSILTVPWSEMGGKVQLTCPQTDYTSTLVFHTKPMYGGKLHRVTGDIKDNMTSKYLYKIEGEWNGKLMFTDENTKTTEIVDTEVLNVVSKTVKPIYQQKENESRRLWRDVTLALTTNDIDRATAAKHKLEERQRQEGKARIAGNVEWIPTYFEAVDDTWVYKKSMIYDD